MPKKPFVPKYRRHKSGQAFVRSVRINEGRNVYLGKYGSEESQRAYSQLINQLAAAGEQPLAQVATRAPKAIVELIVLFAAAAESKYTAGGRVKREFRNVQLALRNLDELHGDMLASAYEPCHLEAFQDYLISKGICRRIVNRRTSIIKRFWAWCSSHSTQTGVRKTMYHELLSVKGVQAGERNAREAPDVRPVPLAIVEKTLPWMSPVVATMVKVQLICGMRPAEVCQLRMADVDTRRKCWIYSPPAHKNAWRNQVRMIAIPPIAQRLLEPLINREPAAYVFSPSESERLRRDAAAQQAGKNRKTKVFPCEQRERDRRRMERLKRHSAEPAGDCYDTASYRRAIKYALRKAEAAGVKIPHWHPHRLRHTASTKISQQINQQASQRWLGHTNLATTDIYTERQRRELLKIAKRLERHWEGTILARTPRIAKPELNCLTNPTASENEMANSTRSPDGSSMTSQRSVSTS